MTTGFMHGKGKPKQVGRFLSALALAENIDFYCFHESDVNTEDKTINGWVWDVESCDFIKKIKPYPDIVEGRGGSSLRIRRDLQRHSVMTVMHNLRDKTKTYKVLENYGYRSYLIDSFFYRDVDIDEMLTRYGSLIIKPNGSALGEGVHKLNRAGSMYLLRVENTEENLTQEAFHQKYSERFSSKSYLVQPYCNFSTKLNQPFDIRINVQRGARGEWVFINALIRCGTKNSIVSNVAKGGIFICEGVDTFLREGLDCDPHKVLASAKRLCRHLPDIIQLGYPNRINLIAFDIAVDRDNDNQLKLIEINASPILGIATRDMLPVKVENWKDLYKNREALLKAQIDSQSPDKKDSVPSPNMPFICREAPQPLQPLAPPRYIESEGWYHNPDSIGTGEASLMFLGDLMARIEQQKKAHREDGSHHFNASFKYVKEYFREADLVTGNLEGTLSHSFPYRKELTQYMGEPNCNAPATYLDALRFAGIDAVVAANNHCCDAGEKGIHETLQHLRNYRIPNTGVFLSPEDYRFLALQVNGIKIAILSYSSIGFNRKSLLLDGEKKTYMINKYSAGLVKRDVVLARKHGAEFVAIYIHWGKEHTHILTPKQKAVADELANSGADIILGSHPHVLQRFSYITNSNGVRIPVIYSLGNFLADMKKVEKNRDTIILNVKLSKDEDHVKIQSIAYTPCNIVTSDGADNFVVVPLDKQHESIFGVEEAARIRSRIENVIGSQIQPVDTLESV